MARVAETPERDPRDPVERAKQRYLEHDDEDRLEREVEDALVNGRERPSFEGQEMIR